VSQVSCRRFKGIFGPADFKSVNGEGLNYVICLFKQKEKEKGIGIKQGRDRNRSREVMEMNQSIWTLGVLIALLSALNTIFWGFAIREVGDPQFSLDFVLRLAFNRWYIFALASALVASFLSYAVIKDMGVLAGRFFLSLSMVAVILTSTLVLEESLTLKEWIGIALIFIGVALVGRW